MSRPRVGLALALSATLFVLSAAGVIAETGGTGPAPVVTKGKEGNNPYQASNTASSSKPNLNEHRGYDAPTSRWDLKGDPNAAGGTGGAGGGGIQCPDTQ